MLWHDALQSQFSWPTANSAQFLASQQHQQLSSMQAAQWQQQQRARALGGRPRRNVRRRRPHCLAACSLQQQPAPARVAAATGTQLQQQQQQQQPAAAAALASLRAAALLGASPRVLLAAVGGFCLTAASVARPGAPASPLLQLDGAVHTAVAAALEPAWRAGVADVLISDAAISVGLAGWAACSAYSLAAAPRAAAPQLALAWLTYLATCGCAWGRGDPPLVHALKAAFARTRPSDLHHSFSFPSGHTSAAVFTVGGLLLVLLPLALRLSHAAAAQAPGDKAGQQQQQQEAASPAWVYMLWGAAGALTAAGRVLADAHWLSDTLAGGCLGVAVVSALAAASQRLEQAGGGADRRSSSGSVEASEQQ